MRRTCEPVVSWVQQGNQNAQKQMKILNHSGANFSENNAWRPARFHARWQIKRLCNLCKQNKQFCVALATVSSKTANVIPETVPSPRPLGRGLAYFLEGRFAVPRARVR